MTSRELHGDDAVPEDDAELRLLRRRAYGPEADIASDPVALARLRELEAKHEDASASHGAAPTDLPPRPPLPVVQAPQRLPPAQSDASGSVPPAPPASFAATWSRRLGRWGRSPRAIAIACVALLVVLAVAIVPGLFADRPDASVRVDPASADEQLSTEYRLFLRQLGVDMDDFARFEDFAALQVWGTPRDAPVLCVLVSDGPDDVRALSCVPRGLDPVADMMIYPGSPVPGDLKELYPEVGDGTAVRFSLRGDNVDVRVVPADPELDLS